MEKAFLRVSICFLVLPFLTCCSDKKPDPDSEQDGDGAEEVSDPVSDALDPSIEDQDAVMDPVSEEDIPDASDVPGDGDVPDEVEPEIPETTWSISLAPLPEDCSDDCRFRFDLRATPTGVYVLYAGQEGGMRVAKHDLVDGSLIWQEDLDGLANIDTNGRDLFVAALNGTLARRGAEDGSIVWEETGAGIDGLYGIAYDGAAIYTPTLYTDGSYSIDEHSPADGTITGSTPCRTFTSYKLRFDTSPDHFTFCDGTVSQVARADGTVDWTVEVSEDLTGMTTNDEAIYVTSNIEDGSRVQFIIERIAFDGSVAWGRWWDATSGWGLSGGTDVAVDETGLYVGGWGTTASGGNDRAWKIARYDATEGTRDWVVTVNPSTSDLYVAEDMVYAIEVDSFSVFVLGTVDASNYGPIRLDRRRKSDGSL